MNVPTHDLTLNRLQKIKILKKKQMSSKNRPDDPNDKLVRSSIDDSTCFEQTAEWND